MIAVSDDGRRIYLAIDSIAVSSNPAKTGKSRIG